CTYVAICRSRHSDRPKAVLASFPDKGESAAFKSYHIEGVRVSRTRSGALYVGAHRVRLGLDPVHPVFDQVADRHDSTNLAAIDHRQMTDSALGDEGEGVQHMCVRIDSYGRRAHHAPDLPVERLAPVLAQAIDDVALGNDADDPPILD